MTYFFGLDIYSKRKKMKLKITTSQFKEILNSVNPKYPITIIMKGIDKVEREELTQLLKRIKN